MNKINRGDIAAFEAAISSAMRDRQLREAVLSFEDDWQGGPALCLRMGPITQDSIVGASRDGLREIEDKP